MTNTEADKLRSMLEAFQEDLARELADTTQSAHLRQLGIASSKHNIDLLRKALGMYGPYLIDNGILKRLKKNAKQRRQLDLFSGDVS